MRNRPGRRGTHQRIGACARPPFVSRFLGATIRDDDAQQMPSDPVLADMEWQFEPGCVLPTNDGGGNPANNKQTVPYIRNSAITDAELDAAGGLESDGNRQPDYWVAYIQSAFQPEPYVWLWFYGVHAGDKDPNIELASLGAATRLGGRGAFIFCEPLRERGEYLACLAVHEIAHEFGVRDAYRRGDVYIPLDIMGVDRYLPGAHFTGGELWTVASLPASPGRR